MENINYLKNFILLKINFLYPSVDFNLFLHLDLLKHYSQFNQRDESPYTSFKNNS